MALGFENRSLSGSNHAVVARSRTNEQCVEFEIIIVIIVIIIVITIIIIINIILLLIITVVVTNIHYYVCL